jgi:type VI secretion system lysozyme-like protein
MQQRKINRGVLPPLFDRIVDEKRGETQPKQLLNTQELKDSIIHELSIILNTRCTVRKAIYEDHIETIPFFGSPDFFGLNDSNSFDGSNTQDWPRTARFIETAIQAAEPRLTNIHVQVDRYDGVSQALYITVLAVMKERNLHKEVQFPLTLFNISASLQKAAA